MSSSPTTPIEAGYVVDTHALLWHLKADKQLGAFAKQVFNSALGGQTQLIVSVIVIAELYYLNQKKHYFPDFAKTYHHLKQQPYFLFFNFVPDEVLDFQTNSSVPEMHDRIIAGLARRLSMPLITRDPQIIAAGICRIAW